MSATFELVRRRSTAADFHALPIPDPARPEIWVHDVTAPALVLGSTQRDDVVDADACAEAGVAVVRRRSGGGAVLLRPREVVWIDVILPAGGPGWADDVHTPMYWVGSRLGAVIAQLTGHRVDVHSGPMQTTARSALVCFDGVGAGEVLVGRAKLIGISQRRTRFASRLQCCWYIEHDPADLTSLLAVDVDPSELRPVATLTGAAAEAVPELLLEALTR